MRIGIEAQRLFREKKHGMDFVALELIRALKREDKKNTYFIFVNEGPDRCLKESENFKIIEFKGWYPVWEQIKLPAKCREYGIEVLHCTSNLAPLSLNIPLVVTVHDIIYMEGRVLLQKGFTPYQRFGNLYRRLLARKILKKAKKIITVSHLEESLLLQLPGVDAAKVEVVHNAVGHHFLNKVGQEALEVIKRRYGLPEGFMLFLGNTDPKKNTENTLLAFVHFCENHYSELQLVVADMEESLAGEILRTHGKEHFLKQMLFPGYISNTDMPAVLRQAQIFLYPSKRESFGIPILEAMACEVPVVTSNVFSMPEVAGEAAVLVNPVSVESIGMGIASLAESQQLRTEMIKKGKERLKLFSWENSARKIRDIYTN